MKMKTVALFTIANAQSALDLGKLNKAFYFPTSN